MILPNKTIILSNSYLGLGSILLKELNSPQTVNSFWKKISKMEKKITFMKFSTTLDFLYSLDLIKFKNNLLRKVNK